MKNIISLRWPLCWLSATVAVLITGCATPEMHSFNHDFGEALPTDPKYSIQDEDAEHFTITVNQGAPSTGAERILDIKTAASDIAKAECHRRGWEKWNMGFIQEKNQGWMHVVIAEVTREKYIPSTFPQSNGNP